MVDETGAAPRLEGRPPEEAKAAAIAAFRDTSRHTNCAQALMLFTLDLLGGRPELSQVARYLGGGIGKTGGACGVLTGAALSLGMRDSLYGDSSPERAAEGCAQFQELQRDFVAAFGDTECRELTGCELSTAAGNDRFRDEGIREKQCVGYIDWMCDRLAELL